MASTFQLQDSINYALPFVRYKPLTNSLNQPALESANEILQTFLAPPFVWRSNRKINPTTINIGQGQQDFIINVPDFGFLEKVSIAPTRGTPKELEIVNVMAPTTAKEMDEPNFIGPVLDDNQGNVTFRILPAANKAYTGNLVYQMKPFLFTSLTQTWSPIPDEYSFVYNQGFVYKAYEYFDDPRAQSMKQQFALSLLGISEGLDDQQKNLFLGRFLDTMRQVVRANAGSQQAIQGRAV